MSRAEGDGGDLRCESASSCQCLCSPARIKWYESTFKKSTSSSLYLFENEEREISFEPEDLVTRVEVREERGLHGHNDEELCFSTVKEGSKGILARTEVVGIASGCSVSEERERVAEIERTR